MRHIEHNFQAELARLRLRGDVFEAIANNTLHTNGPALEQKYYDQELLLTPLSVKRWAFNTGQNVEEASREFTIRTFEKDIEIAEKFKDGVEIDGKLIYLAEVRRKEYLDSVRLCSAKAKLC